MRASLGLKPLKLDDDEAPEAGKQAPGTSTIDNDVLVSGTVPVRYTVYGLPQPRPTFHSPACLPACPPACPPGWLPAWLPGCLPACLAGWRPACRPACLPACLNGGLHVYFECLRLYYTYALYLTLYLCLLCTSAFYLTHRLLYTSALSLTI